MAPTACFVSASSQNVFFAELLDALADELSQTGVAIERAVDHFPPTRDGLAYVFVPHELLPLLMDDARPNEHQLKRSVVICTEQPGTHWFDEAADAAGRAARAVDINQLGVSALRERGVDARLLQLGYTRRWDRWHGEPHASRPIDVALLAGATPRRLKALASCAGQLAGRPTELHLPEALVPHTADSPLFISGAAKWSLLSQSKLLMNVHRGELGYFEWQRAVEAIANGCVLLSEHSLGFEPLVPGEHFVSVSLDSLDVALEALLADPERLERIRGSAYRLLRERYPLSAAIDVLGEAITEAASIPAPAGAEAGRPAGPRPKPPNRPPPAWERVSPGEEPVSTSRLPAPPGNTATTSGSPQARPSVARVGLPDPTDAAGRRSPRVSVLLTVANQAQTVGASIASIALGGFREFELVIVDDGSNDGSADRIGAALAAAPWMPATVLTNSRPSGLAHARNCALDHATGELALVMEARDALYPNAIERLACVLEQSQPASFAYGIFEQDGQRGPKSLTNYLGWDPEMLRYGNFIEAAPMFRRQSLDSLGGYATDAALAGWEDLALWCALAESKAEGVRVPEVVGRRRLQPDSTPRGVADAKQAWALLLDRFRFLSASVAA